MNILIINHYAGSTDFGMEYRHQYMAEEWIRKGHNVTIIAGSYSHLRNYNPKLNEPYRWEEHKNINYCWIRIPEYEGNGIKRVFNILSFAYNALKYCKQSLGVFEPDVVITSSTHPMDIFAGRSVAKKYDIPLIYEVHDIWPLTPMELGGISKWNPFIMIMQYSEDLAYKKAHQVISMLPKAKDHMVSRGMKPSKFNYIPNGVSTKEWSDEAIVLPNEHLEKLKLIKDENKFIVGYAGGFGVSQDLESFLKSAKLCKSPRTVLVLVGDGDLKDDYIKKYESDKVVFLPSINKSQIPALLKYFDVAFLGSQKSSLYRFGVNPNKLFDYMMAGKPIIQAIDAGNNPVKEIGCGMSIEPENPSQLANAIEKFAKMSPGALSEIGQLGKNFTLNNYTYSVLAKKFINIIDKSIEIKNDKYSN